MKALVVYESAYGNTRAAAEAVAAGLAESAEVVLRAVGDAGPEQLAGADLLVVGGPTHVHGLVSHRSLQAAQEDALKHPEELHFEGDLDGPPLREWLDARGAAEGVRAAAFDTRIGKPRLVTGSAAKRIARRLELHGYQLVAPPESFVVDGSAGPLHEGELERAREWGRVLAGTAVPTA
ncbi:MAG: flavodoxin domain-containing protein [Thermoleophilia bacterium]|nr:flavodoxin domain-containing protein [Thermoleophilia bacterium]